MGSLSAIVVPMIGWPEELLRLFVAASLGGAIGLEREFRERQAGHAGGNSALRTEVDSMNRT